MYISGCLTFFVWKEAYPSHGYPRSKLPLHPATGTTSSKKEILRKKYIQKYREKGG
jgi:hypothetical protein